MTQGVFSAFGVGGIRVGPRVARFSKEKFGKPSFIFQKYVPFKVYTSMTKEFTVYLNSHLIEYPVFYLASNVKEEEVNRLKFSSNMFYLLLGIFLHIFKNIYL